MRRAAPVGMSDCSRLLKAGPVFEPCMPAAIEISTSSKRLLQPSCCLMKPMLPARNRVPTRLKECERS
jgi:hypothetical protein